MTMVMAPVELAPPSDNPADELEQSVEAEAEECGNAANDSVKRYLPRLRHSNVIVVAGPGGREFLWSLLLRGED